MTIRKMGPLVVSRANPRYFAVRAGEDEQIVYLTGSHINNNLQDGMGPGSQRPASPERFDYDAYLAFLEEHGHNFIRFWRWEQFQGFLGMANVHFFMTPQPWARTGPGVAKDGLPKFDLTRFDEAYFGRLRERVARAAEAGIYASVMLFEGFSMHLTSPPDHVEGHPFHALNNVNGVSVRSIRDYQTLPLEAGVRELQEAYIRKVIDTVADLPNVLYEVANESSGQDADSMKMEGMPEIPIAIGDTTEWQYWVIRFVKEYERQRGHTSRPVGMTYLVPVADHSKANDPLWASPADWISPGLDDARLPGQGRWLEDPPANDGRKVVLSDTDHFAPFGAPPVWAWKTFLRGHNPLLYDLGIVTVGNPSGTYPGAPTYESYRPTRLAIADTLAVASKVDLARMQPRGDLSSSGYALAHPGHEYVVLQVADGPITVTLEAGRYEAAWLSVADRAAASGGEVLAEQPGPTTLRPPAGVATPAVLHLKRAGR
jgi:hypothetical protein